MTGRQIFNFVLIFLGSTTGGFVFHLNIVVPMNMEINKIGDTTASVKNTSGHLISCEGAKRNQKSLEYFMSGLLRQLMNSDFNTLSFRHLK